MSAPRIAPALDLAGDGDELDLILGIEQAFGVELDDEAATWVTLGDVADWLEARTGSLASGEKCATAVTFHRLRAAVGDRRLKPSARLVDLLPGVPGKELKRLGATTGLRLPGAGLAGLGIMGVWLNVAAFVSLFGLFAGMPLWIAIGLAVPGIVLLRLDRGVYPVETLGQLAKLAAPLNHARLAGLGARHDRETIWRTLVGLAEQLAEAKPGTVGRETRLYA